MKYIFFLLLLATFASPSSAEIYQWKDENGNIQFSDTRPIDVTPKTYSPLSGVTHENRDSEKLNKEAVANLGCHHDLVTYKNRTSYYFLVHFAQCWNEAIDELQEVIDRCKKPDVVNLTTGSTRKEYEQCYRENLDDRSKRAQRVNWMKRQSTDLTKYFEKHNIAIKSIR